MRSRNTGSNIVLNSSTNMLTGDVLITSGNDVSIKNGKALKMGTSDVTGKLNIEAVEFSPAAHMADSLKSTVAGAPAPTWS